MKNVDGIIAYVDYGEIVFNIKKIMKQKKLTKTQIVKKTGLHHQVIERYMSGNIARLDRDILAKLCYVLDCNLQDIMFYRKPEKAEK